MYPKSISNSIKLFKAQNLDEIFVVTNAPGRSAFNRVERRMAPLSNQLDLILQHDAFGSHLDNQNRTIDKDLELKNFAHADETLASIWSEMMIDKFPVVAEYIIPTDNPDLPSNITYDWYLKHVRESQYLLKVNKNRFINGVLTKYFHI